LRIASIVFVNSLVGPEREVFIPMTVVLERRQVVPRPPSPSGRPRTTTDSVSTVDAESSPFVIVT